MAVLGNGETPRSGYPSAIDSITTEYDAPGANKTKVRANVPNDQGTAIVNIQTELGINPSGSKDDVVTYLQTEHGADGTHDNTSVMMLAGAQTVTGVKTLGANLLFTDATYNIGASGATRPQDIFLTRFIGFNGGTDNSTAVGMHIQRSSATQTAVADSVLTVENGTHSYLQFLGGEAYESGLKMGDAGGAEQGGLLYDNTADKWNFVTATSVRASLDATQFSLASSVFYDANLSTPGTILRARSSDSGRWHINMGDTEPRFVLSDGSNVTRVTVDTTNGNMVLGSIDISSVSAGSPSMKITGTSDIPTVAFTGGGSAPTTAPAGYMEILVGVTPFYIPYWA